MPLRQPQRRQRRQRRRAAVAGRVCRYALLLCALDGVADGADLAAVARGDGEFPQYNCPLSSLNLNLECNIREAIKYLNPANDPDDSYDNIRLKTHVSDNPDFVYYWDQTRAVYVDYHLRIGTRGAPDDEYAIIEGYDGPDHVEDEEAYYDAGFILVGDGGDVYLECIKFQHFNRLVLPALSLHSYPTLDSTMSHGGVLAARGGYLDILACQFFNNSAKQGGAVYVAGTGDNVTASVRVASATSFSSNYAQFSGGAMYVEASTPVVVDIGTDRDSSFLCSDYYNLYEPTTAGITLIETDADCGVRFVNNRAGYYGGALTVASDVPPTLDYTQDVTVHEYCDFSSNVAGTDGGGVYMYYTPGVELKSYVTFSNNEATFGGGLYGSRMLTFVLGGSSVFTNNFADDCGGGMYVNIAGCANPCQPGSTDSSIQFSGNSAGNTQGDCPAATVLDDQSFGTKNCTYVTGFNCTPTSDEVDTSYFPIDWQLAGLYEVEVQVNYNRFTVEEVLEMFMWECNATVADEVPSSCLTDCKAHRDDLACVDDEDQCESQPCENGATCYDSKNAFVCDCPAGFDGLQCETNIPDCLSAPCQNGATCEDGIVNYTCVCTALYEGTHCETLRPDVLFGAAPPTAAPCRGVLALCAGAALLLAMADLPPWR